MAWGILCVLAISSATLFAPPQSDPKPDDDASNFSEPDDAPKAEAPKPEAAPIDKAALTERLLKLHSRDAPMADYVAKKLTQLPPEEGIAILKENWARIASPLARYHLLYTWYVMRSSSLVRPSEDMSGPGYRPRNHPKLLDALDLGMRDPAPSVQRFALAWTSGIALQDFAEDFQAYERWYQANREKPVETVVKESLVAFVARLKQNDDVKPATLARLIDRSALQIRSLPNARQEVTDAGLLTIIEPWLTAAAAEQASGDRWILAHSALRLLKSLKMDEEYLRRVIEPLLAEEVNDNVRRTAVMLLGRKEMPWAGATLQGLLKKYQNKMLAGPREEFEYSNDVIWIAKSLGETDDVSAIPPLINLICEIDSHELIHLVGRFGLEPLTGVPQDDAHDGAWWAAWWQKNKEKYPKELREQTFTLRVRQPEEP